MIVAARPTLKATMRANPSPDAVEGNRAEQNNQGRWTRQQPGGKTNAEKPPPTVASLVVWFVGMVMAVSVMTVMVLVSVVVVVMMAVIVLSRPCRAPHLDSASEYRAADEHHQEARDNREPRVQVLGHDELGKQERHGSEREDSRCARDRDDATEHERVAGPPAGPDEVAGHDRLAVPGRESMRSSPEGSDDERDQDHTNSKILLRDQRLEAA